MKPTFKNQIKEAEFNVEYLHECKNGFIKTSVLPHILDQLITRWTKRYNKLVSFIPKESLAEPKKLLTFDKELI